MSDYTDRWPLPVHVTGTKSRMGPGDTIVLPGVPVGTDPAMVAVRVWEFVPANTAITATDRIGDAYAASWSHEPLHIGPEYTAAGFSVDTPGTDTSGARGHFLAAGGSHAISCGEGGDCPGITAGVAVDFATGGIVSRMRIHAIAGDGSGVDGVTLTPGTLSGGTVDVAGIYATEMRGGAVSRVESPFTPLSYPELALWVPGGGTAGSTAWSDSSPAGFAISRGGAAVVSADYKNGVANMTRLPNVNTDYVVTSTPSPSLSLAGGDFTFEIKWVFGSVPASKFVFFAVQLFGWVLGWDATQKKLRFNGSVNGSSWSSTYYYSTARFLPVAGTLYKIRVTRGGNTLKYYINDIQLGYDIPCNETFYATSAPLYIGYHEVQTGIASYFADAQMYKGVSIQSATAPVYAAGTSTVILADPHNTRHWLAIEAARVTEALRSGTVSYALSAGDGTWYVWDGAARRDTVRLSGDEYQYRDADGSWVTVGAGGAHAALTRAASVDANRMTAATLAAITPAQWQSLFSPGAAELQYAITLSNPVSTSAPSVSDVLITRSAAAAWCAATTGIGDDGSYDAICTADGEITIVRTISESMAAASGRDLFAAVRVCVTSWEDHDAPAGPQGPQGDPGAPGADGESATITIGAVTAGDEPRVYNSGTASAAVLDFVLPRGPQGDPGPPSSILPVSAAITSDAAIDVAVTGSEITVEVTVR